MVKKYRSSDFETENVLDGCVCIHLSRAFELSDRKEEKEKPHFRSCDLSSYCHGGPCFFLIVQATSSL